MTPDGKTLALAGIGEDLACTVTIGIGALAVTGAVAHPHERYFKGGLARDASRLYVPTCENCENGGNGFVPGLSKSTMQFEVFPVAGAVGASTIALSRGNPNTLAVSADGSVWRGAAGWRRKLLPVLPACQ